MREKVEKTISKQDIMLIGGILVLSTACFLVNHFSRKTGYHVEISIDGKTVEEFSLDKDAVYEVEQDVGNNKVVIVNGEAAVTEADCPDKVCKKHSPISKVGETIICLPHRVVVEIVE